MSDFAATLRARADTAERHRDYNGGHCHHEWLTRLAEDLREAAVRLGRGRAGVAPDLTRLWNDAEAIYEREFPEPRHYFGMLPTLAKVAYFEQAAIEAIERAAGLPHTVRARVVSVEEMKRYLHAAVPTEITDG